MENNHCQRSWHFFHIIIFISPTSMLKFFHTRNTRPPPPPRLPLSLSSSNFAPPPHPTLFLPCPLHTTHTLNHFCSKKTTTICCNKNNNNNTRTNPLKQSNNKG
jgi:hypothetical protein